MENAFHEQRNRSLQVTSAVPDPTALLVINDAERVKEAGLDQVRNHLLTQMERILEINALQEVTKAVVARESLVIGGA
jgi:hypothetical protein